MGKTTLYVLGGVAVVGGILYLSRQKAPQGSGASPKRMIPVDTAGAAVLNAGGRAVSLIDKWLSARQSQQAAIDYGAGTTFPSWGSSPDNVSGTGNDIFAIGTG